MVHKHIGIPSDFFPEVLPGLSLGELRVYLQVVWDQRWFSGKPRWFKVDHPMYRWRYGIIAPQVDRLLEILAHKKLVELRTDEEGQLYVRLRWQINDLDQF
jgi:hypothetical protein